MVGESPEFDVFLSYRVKSDQAKVSLLFEALTAAGLKVWWDKHSLEPGMPWEEGFTNGLLKSRVFVPLLSRFAIHHPSETSQNFCLLREDSDCDNLLLELRLALDLQARGLVENIREEVTTTTTTTTNHNHHQQQHQR